MEERISSFFKARFNQQTVSSRQLSGGASQETWMINCEDRTYILRRPPGGIIPEDARSIGPEKEAMVMAACHTQSISVPEIIHIFTPDEDLYPGYIMRFVAGETLAHKILRDAAFDEIRPKLAQQCGEMLARIHAIPQSEVSGLMRSDAISEIDRYHKILRQHGHPHPVFELAFQWLREHVPLSRPTTLVHGDFRNGNLIIDHQEGLAAIIDWELSHLGDPMEDLGWICVPSWRFGEIQRPVGGFGLREDLYAAYEAAGGTIDREAARFWEILGALKWGIMCLVMIDVFTSGLDRSVERAAIGRRSSETEMDLLLMLEGEI